MEFERLEFIDPFLRQCDMKNDEKEIVLRHGHIAITNYKLGDNRDFEKLLSVWDKMYWRYNQAAGYYVKELKEFRIGRGFDLHRLHRLFPNRKIRVENTPYSADKVAYNLTTPPKSDFQEVALTFMAAQPPYTKNKDFTQQLIDADTGDGKAMPDDTLIPTPTGFHRLGDLRIGDMVYNLHGEPVEVLNIYPQKGLQPTFRITFSDGRSTRCNPEHLWKVFTREGEEKILPLSDFIGDYHGYKIPTTTGVGDDYIYGTRRERKHWLNSLLYGNNVIYSADSYTARVIEDYGRSLGYLVYTTPIDAENYRVEIVKSEYLEIINIEFDGLTRQRCILIDDPEHLYLAEDYIPTHNTYCGVAISAYYKARSVIVCPISKLLEQWRDSYLKFTDLDKKQVMIVKGSKACEKIRTGQCRDKVVFIFTSDTIMSYINTHGNRACIEMMMQTGAYIKIIDEIHKDMKIVSAIEAMCNFPLNFYMSASPRRSDRKENFIFDLTYKNVPRFGSNFKQKEERHINIVVKYYRFIPTDDQIRSMYRKNIGLNTKAYERVLINASDRQREDFDFAVSAMLNWSKDLVKKDNKILILCQTVDGTKYMEDLAEKVFPKQCSHYYATGMSKTAKEEALKKKVICATASSMGTGADIANLQHVINICTYSNPIDASQLPGRARKLKDGTPVVYVELVNMGYRKTVSQYESRRSYLINKAANGKILTIR